MFDFDGQLELATATFELPSDYDLSDFETRGITLTQAQRDALDGIIRWIQSPLDQEALLRGYAGTGKTTIVQTLCNLLECYVPDIKIGQCAYSNKARKNMQRMIYRAGLNIDALTCCTMLGMKMKRQHGKMTFVADRKTQAQIEFYDFVIVDEAYCLGDTMIDLFSAYANQGQVKVLYVGDNAQLGPIEQLHSPVETKVKKSNTFVLDKVVRYGGAVLDYATTIRGDLTKLHSDPQTYLHDEQTKGIHSSNRQQWQALAARAFRDFREFDPEDRRILAYTNKRVRELNHFVRGVIYDKDPRELKQFEIGERLVFHEPYSKSKLDPILFHTSDEVTVFNVVPKKTTMFDLTLNILELQVSTDTGSLVAIPVVAQDSIEKYREQRDCWAKNRVWGCFWDIHEAFAWVEYAYAMTTHKSQGSTFKDVFVDLHDFRKALNHKNSKEPFAHIIQYNRLNYTASTRPEDRVFFGL